MKKFTLSIFLLCLHALVFSQLRFEATPEYGKLWDITYDSSIQNRVYAITEVNHIMVSNDNGATWNILYSFPSDASYLSSLKIAPGGNALSFVVKESADTTLNGLYIFDLGGDTIKHKFTPPNWEGGSSIVSYGIYGAGDSIILLNTFSTIDFNSSSNVFYTADAGTNWKEIYASGNNADIAINNCYISPADGGKLYLTRGEGTTDDKGGLWISADSGTTWVTKLDGKVLGPMGLNPANAQDVWVGTATDFTAADEALYHSTDGGDNWQQVQNLPLHNVDYGLNDFNYITFSPSNPQTIWVLEENEYLKSTNGGTDWQSTYFDVNDTVYYYGEHASINPFDENQVFIVSDGFPQFSADGGATLKQVKNPFYTVVNVSYGNYKASQHLYYTSQDGYMEKNLGTGITTSYLVESPYTINGSTHSVVADSSVEGRVFVYTPGDGFISTSVLALSDDYGETLQPIPADDFSSEFETIAKEPGNNYSYWASFSDYGSGTLYKLDLSNPGAFASQQITTPSSYPVTGIYVTPGYPDSVLIAEGATIYSTSDGGNTWQPQTSGLEGFSDENDAIWCMQVNPFNSSQFMIATNKGIYASQDGGSTWSGVLTGLDIRKIGFSPFVNGAIVAAAYSGDSTGCELFYTTNGGGNWLSVPLANIAYLQSENMSFNFYTDSVNVYFATQDIGVAKYTLSGLNGTLPLRLLSFTGTIKDNGALLQWQTAAEKNIRRFAVERSLDASHFTAITAVAAANSAGNHLYDYTDIAFSAVSGKQNNPVYYRLKMADADGRFSYSPVVKLVRPAGTVTGITVYPNPVAASLNLRMTNTAGGSYNIAINSISGKQYYSSSYQLPQGESFITIPLGDLAKGVYIVSVKAANGQTTSLKFVK
ncbi:MAG TPA: T9SS type A sorting domain-containing protein [Chitinophagaceae bacterium]|nr:T9SS type A sorting domain-containing protein [Chitinophagaceae bacterium]